MIEKNELSILEAKRIARDGGYKAGMPLSEFQMIQIVSAAYSFGLKAAREEKRIVLPGQAFTCV